MDGRDEVNEGPEPAFTGGPLGVLGMLSWLLGLVFAFVAIVEARPLGSYVGPAIFLLIGGLMVAADPDILYPARREDHE